MELYKPSLSYEAHVMRGFPVAAMVFGIIMLIVARVQDATLFAFLSAALGFFAYLHLGEARKRRYLKTEDGLLIVRRSMWAPFSKGQIELVPYGSMAGLRIEDGPRSQYGPQVLGQTVLVLTTDSGDIRIFSRWLSKEACRQLLSDLNAVVRKNGGRWVDGMGAWTRSS